MTIFGFKFKTPNEVEVLKKIISDKDNIIADKDNIISDKDRIIADATELMHQKNRTSQDIKLVLKEMEKIKISKNSMTNTILTGLRENIKTAVNSIITSHAQSDNYCDNLEREVKTLKFKLSNSEKKNKSILEYKGINNRFDLLQKICSNIDTFIKEEEDVFERRVDTTLINKKILDYGSAFGVSSDRMSYNIIMILKVIYGNEYMRYIRSSQLTDVIKLLKTLDTVTGDEHKEVLIDQFINEKTNHRSVTSEVNSKFNSHVDIHIEIAKNATLCEIFRKFTLKSIKLNSKVKLLLETIKDSLVVMSDRYDEELMRLSVENKKLKDDIKQIVADDKDKTIRELQMETASLRLEIEALRYKKGGE